MPRYFFHIAGDDGNGIELPDDAAARAEALQTFGAMIRDGCVEAGTFMEVVDASGRRVTMLRFLIDQ